MQVQNETRGKAAAENAEHSAATQTPQSAMGSVRLILGALAAVLALGGVFFALRGGRGAAPQATVDEAPQAQAQEPAGVTAQLAPEWSEGTVHFSLSGDVLTISGTGTVPQITGAEAKAAGEIRIEEGISAIGDFAFFLFSSLERVTIPASVTDIGSYAFLSCGSLESVTLPEGVTRIGNNAFADCISLKSAALPNSLTTIGAGAFSGCTALRRAAIPSGVTELRGSVFDGCSSLTRVIIPGSVSSIHDTAFFRCDGLSEVYFTGTEAQWKAAGRGKIAETAAVRCNTASWSEGTVSYTLSGHTLILTGTGTVPETNRERTNPAQSIEIWEGITEIGENAFWTNQSMRELTLPEGVTRIGDAAFYSCTHLKAVDIPDSVTSIGNDAFSGCRSLSSVTIPKSVTDIGSGAFANCGELLSVTVPDSVASIGSRAFHSAHLKDICYTGTEEQWNAIAKEADAVPEAAEVHFGA